MPRRRTQRIEDIKQKLIERVESGYYHPGDRFFSNRSISTYFKISYKTAHILLQELEESGYIGRKAQSGTYMKGNHRTFKGVALYFDERAKVSESFGERLLNMLTEKLDMEKIPWVLIWATPDQTLLEDYYPIIWESHHIQQFVAEKQVFGLLLNEKPEPGLISSWIDSITLDDFSGGVSAAQIIDIRYPGSKVAVYSGPSSDYRNNNRVTGFLSIIPDAYTVSAGSWYFSDGLKNAHKIMDKKPHSVFCANDRLAYSLIKYCINNDLDIPQIIGFDDAPISEKAGFSTIAIPWNDVIKFSMQVVKERLSGDTSSTKQSMLNTRPLLRGFFLKR